MTKSPRRANSARTTMILKNATALGLYSILGVLAALAGERQNPPPEDRSWFLLSNNDNEVPATPEIETGLIYWCDPLPNGPRDRKGALGLQEYEFDGPIYTEGRRLLDNDYPSPSWHTVIGWAPLKEPAIVTFDLKKKFIICRVDVQMHPSDGGSGRTPRTVPECLTYYFNETDDWKDVKAWKKGGQLDIDPEDMPDWLLSKFAPGLARFVRIEIEPKRGESMYVKEVRIWGKKP